MNTKNSIVIAMCVGCWISLASECRAGLIQTFQADNTTGFSLAGNTYTRTLTGLVADGVTFDATLTIQGFSPDFTDSNLNAGSSGVGVNGESGMLVNDGEQVRFTLAVANEIGGTVTFDGFTEVDYNNFGAADSGVLSLDIWRLQQGTTSLRPRQAEMSLIFPQRHRSPSPQLLHWAVIPER